MTIALKISKPTFNVLTTGNTNLAFSSELATHSIYQVTSASISGANTSTTINHNLGFVPKTWIFWKSNDGVSDFLSRIPLTTGNEYDYYVTSSDIVISRFYASGTDNFYVVIFTRSPNP